MDNLGTFPLIGANSRSGVLLLGPFLTQSEPILCCDFRLLSRGFLIQLSISVLWMVYHRFRFLEIRLLSGSTVFRINCARFGQDAIRPAVEPFEGVNSWWYHTFLLLLCLEQIVFSRLLEGFKYKLANIYLPDLRTLASKLGLKFTSYIFSRQSVDADRRVQWCMRWKWNPKEMNATLSSTLS